MSERIIVHNKPSLQDLLDSGKYTNTVLKNEMNIIEDDKNQKAICHFDENNELEYVTIVPFFDLNLFMENLQSNFDVYWTDITDLMDYNQFMVKPAIQFDELVERVSLASEIYGFKTINNLESASLWTKMNSVQKSKLLPHGYIRNYYRSSNKHSKQKTLDLVKMLKDSMSNKVSFGVLLELKEFPA